jgi:5-methylcytosine-specific restriction endonuclease McrA
MRKLKRSEEPEKLITNRNSLTEEYKKTNKPVWRKKYITETLFESSFGKCAYCGVSLNYREQVPNFEMDEEKQMDIKIEIHENNFLHIDHFIARKYDESKVVDWENLIPACPTCNYKKGAHDVLFKPIINPYKDDFREYFIFYNQFLIVKENDKTPKGAETNKLFLYFERFPKICQKLNNSINDTLHIIQKDVEKAFDERNQGGYSTYNAIKEQIRKLITETYRNSYSSITATILLNHPIYQKIKQKFKTEKCWTFNDLEKRLEEVKFNTK